MSEDVPEVQVPEGISALPSFEDLPFCCDASGRVEGQIKVEPEDFRVDEIPAYPLTGEGEHLFVHFEKRNLDTPRAVRQIANALEADPKQTGWAGLKDRHAITRQWASFFGANAELLDTLDLPDIKILDHSLHRNKLRTGHLQGNRFAVLLRGPGPDALPALQSRLERLSETGLPNYFGAQRFGWGGRNLEKASRWLLEGGRAPRKSFERKLLVSVLQSALFNALLSERVAAGTIDQAELGDLLRKESSGGLFLCEDLALDEPRVQSFEVSPTGPMFGVKASTPTGEPLRREEAWKHRVGLLPEHMERFQKAGPGTRRPYRVPLTDPQCEASPEGIWLRFSLPSGAYATVVVRELAQLVESKPAIDRPSDKVADAD